MTLDTLDRRIAEVMAHSGVTALRYSLGLIFIWFGILKPLGLSPAAPLLIATVGFLPVFTPEQWLGIIGWWEVAIGLTFLFRATLRIAIGLLALQMVGTFMPLFMLPEVTFQAGRIPYAPTMEGQYIIKNLLIISAALVAGGTVRRPSDRLPVERSDERGAARRSPAAAGPPRATGSPGR
jgi:uncharacterized membrane protein YkgB